MVTPDPREDPQNDSKRPLGILGHSFPQLRSPEMSRTYKHCKYPAPAPERLFLSQISFHKFLNRPLPIAHAYAHDLLADLTLSVPQQQTGRNSLANQNPTGRGQQPTGNSEQPGPGQTEAELRLVPCSSLGSQQPDLGIGPPLDLTLPGDDTSGAWQAVPVLRWQWHHGHSGHPAIQTLRTR